MTLKKLPFCRRVTGPTSAMTLIELLVVIAILGILATIGGTQFPKIFTRAQAMKEMKNLQLIGQSTIELAIDRANKLPSPQYPGDMQVPEGRSEDSFFPKYWNYGETGLWLDGAVFGNAILRQVAEPREDEEEGEAAPTSDDSEGSVAGYEWDADGSHLDGTIFVSKESIKGNREEEDLHFHSYAMNASILPDRIYRALGQSDLFLTEKSLSNIEDPSRTMLFIDCSETNVIYQDQIDLIRETAEQRRDNKHIAAVFVDGHGELIKPENLPDPQGQPSPEQINAGILEEQLKREARSFWTGSPKVQQE